MNEYITMRRAEKSVLSACRRRGLAGDPLAEGVPSLGTPNEELTAIAVYLDLPAKMRTPEAWTMCRAAVLTSPGEHPAITRSRRAVG